MVSRREFVAGCAAGAAGQLIGHPLDTLKVRMQTQAGGVRDPSAWHCAKRAFIEGGKLAFFRGLSAPLLSKCIEQSIAFGVRASAETVLSSAGMPVGTVRSCLCGAAAGAATAAFLTPVYLVKVQLQVTTRDGLQGPIRAALRTVGTFGVSGLYMGATPIMLGTTIGYTCRFACYDSSVANLKSMGANNVIATICGGGVAGMATWMSHYPLDLVSAKMQAQALVSDPSLPKPGMVDVFKSVVKTDGIRGLFRGLGPCLVRAFPVNAAIFLTYESVMGSNLNG